MIDLEYVNNAVDKYRSVIVRMTAVACLYYETIQELANKENMVTCTPFFEYTTLPAIYGNDFDNIKIDAIHEKNIVITVFNQSFDDVWRYDVSTYYFPIKYLTMTDEEIKKDVYDYHYRKKSELDMKRQLEEEEKLRKKKEREEKKKAKRYEEYLKMKEEFET